AWSGDTIRIDRIGRGSTIVRNGHLVIGLTVQPAVIDALGDKAEFHGRGLTARFMYSMPPNNVGYRDMLTIRRVPTHLKDAYETRMRQLLTTALPDRPDTLTLDDQAARMFHEWRQALED